jgi:uncharacterized membrane protein YhfC
MVTLPPGWIAAMVVAISIEIVVPLVLGWVAGRVLGVGWRYFWYGALIFFLFQIVTRLPVVQVAQVLLADALHDSLVLTWVWIVVLSFTAGLFEEVGRWVGYRWLFKPEERGWPQAIMYGLGHGGLESMLLFSSLAAVSLLGLLSLNENTLAQMPAEQREAVQTQLAALATQPSWLPLLGAWERLSAIALHVGLSVTVLQVFRRGSMIWLAYAILAHTVVDVAALGLLRLLAVNGPTGIVLVEVAILAMALVSLWVAWRLRDPPVALPLPPEPAA